MPHSRTSRRLGCGSGRRGGARGAARGGDDGAGGGAAVARAHGLVEAEVRQHEPRTRALIAEDLAAAAAVVPAAQHAEGTYARAARGGELVG